MSGAATGRTGANRLGLDYGAEAARLGPPPTPIYDAHLHINGPRAARLLRDAADLFGVRRFLSQTRLDEADAVRDVFGDRVRFVAVPDWTQEKKGRAFREAMLEQLPVWRDQFGARVVKLWGAPQLWTILEREGDDGRDVVPLDSPWRVRVAERAASLGMMFMVHVADPDTWFRDKYADAARFGAKAQQYERLEAMVRRFDVPWIVAHMGGWPENLDFLDGLLDRHDNLYLDTSATKWIVRELGRHQTQRVRAFFKRWRGRLLFGSDIVSTEDHLRAEKRPTASPMAALASDERGARELYASRYWTLRTMFETTYDGESPIADQDVSPEDPPVGDPAAPRLRGLALDRDLLAELYAGTAERVVEAWCARG